MSEQRVTVERDGHVLLMGLNRADKKNAFDIEMYIELAKAYGQLERDPDIFCGVVFAHGDNFTAGLDMLKWAPVISSGKNIELPEGAIDPLGADADKRLNKPIVMAVQGICFTIGLELLLATDIRVAARGVRFGQIEIKRGIYPVGGGTIRLFLEVGWGNAMRYILTADEFGADEAYRMGLVQDVTDKGGELERAKEIAKTIAKQAPLGVQATLKSSRIAQADGIRKAFERLLPDLLPIMTSEDAAEGIKSFLERREAVFKGR